VIGKFRCKQNGLKIISTHIYYWPNRRSKTPKSILLEHQPYAFSIVSLSWSHNGARIQFDFCSEHVRTVMQDIMWWFHNVMWRFR